MQEFRIRPDGFAVIRKRTLLWGIPFTVISASAGILIARTAWDSQDTYSLLIPIAIVGAVIIFSLFRGLKKQKKLLESFRLTIEDNVITREQLNTEELTIYFHEIKEITKSKAGSLFIKGLDKTDIICVPPEIENKAVLESLLNEVKPITPRSVAASRKQKLMPLLSLAFTGLMVTVYLATNKILVGTAAVLVIAGIIWSIYTIRKSKNIDNKTKGRIWIYFILIAAILVSAGLKIFGPEQ
jgi:hypothetical protein